jgi:hypothetical protein
LLLFPGIGVGGAARQHKEEEQRETSFSSFANAKLSFCFAVAPLIHLHRVYDKKEDVNA